MRSSFRQLYRHARGLNPPAKRPLRLAIRWWLQGVGFVHPPAPHWSTRGISADEVGIKVRSFKVNILKCIPSYFKFGVVNETAELPFGWTWDERPREFLTARAGSDGKRFVAQFKPPFLILSRYRQATAEDFHRTQGKLRVGRWFMDDRESFTIPLTNGQKSLT